MSLESQKLDVGAGAPACPQTRILGVTTRLEVRIKLCAVQGFSPAIETQINRGFSR
jgi:hypothetical protein